MSHVYAANNSFQGRPSVRLRLPQVALNSDVSHGRPSMFQPRKTESYPTWSDPDGIKIYTISARNMPVAQEAYASRLNEVKQQKGLEWATTPAFVLMHDGASREYLVLAWWGNDNELFTSVSVKTESSWTEDPSRFSFCLWDLEVIWHERNCFIENIYCPTPSLENYRKSRLTIG